MLQDFYALGLPTVFAVKCDFEPPHELRCRIVTKPFDLRIPPWGAVFRAAADGGGGGGRIQL